MMQCTRALIILAFTVAASGCDATEIDQRDLELATTHEDGRNQSWDFQGTTGAVVDDLLLADEDPSMADTFDPPIDELAAAPEVAGIEYTRVHRRSLTYCLFNCPSNARLYDKASDICHNSKYYGAIATWMSPCHGVAGQPSCRRRWIDFKCWR